MYLYKFFRATEANINNVINQQIWLSEIESFNDPFEGNIEFDRNRFAAEKIKKHVTGQDKEYIDKILLEYNKTEYSEGIHRSVEVLIQQLTQGTWELFHSKFKICANELERIRNNIPFLVTCFSCFNKNNQDDSDEEMLKNIVMWSHYADNHKGFCVKYKIDEKDPVVKKLFKVDYTQTERLSMLELKELMNDINSDKSYEILTKRLLHKYYQWEYEQEFRLITKDGFVKKEKGGVYQFPYIDSIFFGLKMDFELCKKIVLKYKDNRAINMYRVYRDENTSKLISSCWRNEINLRDL